MGYMRDSTDRKLDSFKVADDNSSRFLRSGLAIVGDLGNSIALNGTLSTEGSTVDGITSLGALSYFGYALPKTNGRFRYGGVAATHGFTTAQILATHLPSVLTSDWQYVHMQVLTNDPANGLTFAQTKANVISMVTQLLAVGKIPILCTMPPQGSAVGGTTNPILLQILALNLWVKRYAAEMKIPLVDYHSVLVDPATNEYITGYGNADGVHPVAAGAAAMGNALAAILNSLPSQIRSPLIGAYNPNLMIPDPCLTSATVGEKAVFTGNTGGGWSLKTVTAAPFLKGRAVQFARGSVGDYGCAWPTTGSWVAGHRVRLAFALDVPACPAGGTWNAQLYNYTDAHTILGFSGMSAAMTNRSVTVTDGATTAASNVVTCATSKPFRPNHIGCLVQSGTGVTAVFAAGTTIIGVSPDGTQAYCSANASTTQSAATVVLMGEPLISVWEFDVRADMVGKDIRFGYGASSAAGVSIWVGQVTMQDITALGIA